MKARIVTFGGMGYPLTETQAGMPRLTARLRALGVDTGSSPYTHDSRQAAYNFLHDFDGFIGLAGDSLGAGAACLYAGDIKRPVHYVGGFQPSDYDPIGHPNPATGLHELTVPPNVVLAHCVRDPHWVHTLGLGHAIYVKTPGSKTVVLVTHHEGAHPDDWGWSQDLIFAEIAARLKASGV